jgi:hypothetical protein
MPLCGGLIVDMLNRVEEKNKWFKRLGKEKNEGERIK